LLAAKTVLNQGIEVIGVHFKIPFCKFNIKEKLPEIGIKVFEFDLGKDYLGLIKKPRYGFGSNMNPCIDCKILMFKKAKKLLSSLEANFVVTGEVLGQRPMSQNSQALKLIHRESGLGTLLLRPLSAKFFEPSLAEIKGWVKRGKLFDINGRSRSVQFKLAGELGLTGFLTPAGGCLLTDPGFSRRLKELIEHKELSLNNLELLKIGRHFRINKARLVVGRDEKENLQILKLALPRDFLLFPQRDLAGPTCLIRGKIKPKELILCGQILSSYSDTGNLKAIEVYCKKANTKQTDALMVDCIEKAKIKHLMI